MGKEIVIVTMFFDIGRGSWNNFTRSNDTYFKYFCVWAKLKNKLIAYVDNEELKNKILSFRASYGLEEQTIVNVVTDVKSIDRELYSSINIVSQNTTHKLYRLLQENPEVNSTDYNYVVLLKTWFVNDAVARYGKSNETFAFIDFGFNRGGVFIDPASEFNYKWEYDFPDKICLYLIRDLDERPMFDIVLSLDTYVMGNIMIAPDYLWKDFWLLERQSMIELNNVGLMDDDQTIALMAYRKKPEIFDMKLTSWCMPLVECGGNHLKLTNKKKQPITKKIWNKLYNYSRRRYYPYKMCKRIYTYLRNIMDYDYN